jgi:hypothetical protein
VRKRISERGFYLNTASRNRLICPILQLTNWF